MGEAADEDQGEGENVDDEMQRRVAYVESRPDTFRSMTSLDVGEARDLYKEAAAAASADEQAAGDEGKIKSGGGGAEGAAPAPAREFLSYAEFLMALMMVRKNNDSLIDFVFRAPRGTARASFDEALPVLLRLHGMPRRFARHLVQFGYRLPPGPRIRRRKRGGKESGKILDYM